MQGVLHRLKKSLVQSTDIKLNTEKASVQNDNDPKVPNDMLMMAAIFCIANERTYENATKQLKKILETTQSCRNIIIFSSELQNELCKRAKRAFQTTLTYIEIPDIKQLEKLYQNQKDIENVMLAKEQELAGAKDITQTNKTTEAEKITKANEIREEQRKRLRLYLQTYHSLMTRLKRTDEIINNVKQWNSLSTTDKFNAFLLKYGHISDWDVILIENMDGLFQGYERFNDDISRWNVKRVKSMKGMFLGCKAFNQPIGNWKVGKVRDMSFMFANINYFEDKEKNRQKFNQPLNNWDVTNVTNMKAMFTGCTQFNQPLNKWKVGKVRDMSFMFQGCEQFNNDSLNSWNFTKIKNMHAMFDSCKTFNQPLDAWNVSTVKDMCCMFYGCKNFNQPLNSWKVPKLSDTSEMFRYCEQFNQDISNWNLTENQLTESFYMFHNCDALDKDIKSMIKHNWNHAVKDVALLF
jgi:surface protein